MSILFSPPLYLLRLFSPGFSGASSPFDAPISFVILDPHGPGLRDDARLFRPRRPERLDGSCRFAPHCLGLLNVSCHFWTQCLSLLLFRRFVSLYALCPLPLRLLLSLRRLKCFPLLTPIPLQLSTILNCPNYSAYFMLRRQNLCSYNIIFRTFVQYLCIIIPFMLRLFLYAPPSFSAKKG
mgnify:CR=1 FL=1